MLRPQNRNYPYDHLNVDIEKGIIKIPQFQRDFVWPKEKTAKLIDSMLKGFPIGTLIFWKTKEQLRHMRNIGNLKLKETPAGEYSLYVLDGQQRITSLYAVRQGAIFSKDGSSENYNDIVINLAYGPDDDEEIVVTEPPEDAPYISIHRLLNVSLVELMDEFDKDTIRKIEVYQKILTGYDFSSTVIPDYPLDQACEVFTRINTTGIELTLFEIMVAKTYDEERKFDLAREYYWLVKNDGSEKDLEDADFDTIPPSTILQCVAAYLCQQVRRQDILKIKKNDFIDSWKLVKKGIFKAVDFLRSRLGVPVSQLLPYNALLVIFTYFFINNELRVPSPTQRKLIMQYFWWACLSRRFSASGDSKIAQDLKRMDNILKDEAPEYRGEEIDISVKDLTNCWFSAGDAFCKAILCLYAGFGPRSFEDGSPVTLDNSWLIRANSKNFHHFFPKKFLSKQGVDDLKANCILNITMVDEYLNKGRIRDKAPSKYMKPFAKSNQNLSDSMKSHLIINLDAYGVWTDNYDRFLKKRGQKVIKELRKRLSPKI